MFVTGLLTKLSAERDRAPRVGVREGRRRPVHQPVAELEQNADPWPTRARLGSGSELLRVDRQERRAARKPREIRDVDVGQARRDVVDVDAVDSERLRGVVAVVGLGRERLGLGKADPKLVDELGLITFE